MKVNVMNEKEGEALFVVEGTTPAFMNAVRRLVADEVPTLAIEDIEFRKNSSILYDETIAHRLGLLTLTTDLQTYEFLGEDDEHTMKNSVKLTLSKVGPCTVYAEDLKSTDPKVKPMFGKTPIAKLLEDQELELEATAVLGRGRQHMKWAPGLMFYNYRSDAQSGAKDDKDTGRHDPINYPLCTEANMKPEKLKENVDFMVKLETWGQLSCKEILEQACEVFNQKLDSFAEAVK